MAKRKDKRAARLRGEKTGGPNKAPQKPSYLIWREGDQRKGRAQAGDGVAKAGD